MDDSAYALLGLLVGAYLGSALATLVHEFAHGVAIVALTDRKATIRIGRAKARVHFRLGRLSVYWDPLGAWTSDESDIAQVAFVGGGIPRGRQAVIFAAGPIAALLLGAASVAGALLVGRSNVFALVVFALTALFALKSGLMNLLPVRISGQKTDGRKIIDALRRESSDAVVRQQLWLYLNSGVDRIDERARAAGMSRESWLAQQFSESVIPELHEMARTAELPKRDPDQVENLDYRPQGHAYEVKVGSNTRIDEEGWQYRLSIVLTMAHSDVLLMGAAAKQDGLAPADWIRLEFGRRVVEPALAAA